MACLHDQPGGIPILEEKEQIPKGKRNSLIRKIYNNSKASFKTFRKFQEYLRKEFPNLVIDEKNKKEKEETKDEKGRIQEVYERRIKYY